ncbi:MAG: septal ring lytic transglycosylase RlpA family protein [Acetobacteraceae bacterium]
MQCDRPILEVTRAWATPALVLMLIVVSLAACGSGAAHDNAVARGIPVAPAPDGRPHLPHVPSTIAAGPSVVGIASWYRRGPHLIRTCAGKLLSDDELVAASPTLPVGMEVRVTLLDAGRSVIVRVDDCMPRGHRVIDLSVEAARQLGLLHRGVALVRVTPVAWR